MDYLEERSVNDLMPPRESDRIKPGLPLLVWLVGSVDFLLFSIMVYFPVSLVYSNSIFPMPVLDFEHYLGKYAFLVLGFPFVIDLGYRLRGGRGSWGLQWGGKALVVIPAGYLLINMAVSLASFPGVVAASLLPIPYYVYRPDILTKEPVLSKGRLVGGMLLITLAVHPLLLFLITG